MTYTLHVEPDLPPLFNGTEFELIDISPLEIARQLTLIEFDLFKKVQPKECLKNWDKKERELKAPNIHNVTQRFNLVQIFFSR
jgi:son of sevenless-like protein